MAFRVSTSISTSDGQIQIAFEHSCWFYLNNEDSISIWFDSSYKATPIGLPSHLIRRLQSVQNAAARLIFRLRRSNNIRDALISLHVHWLRVPKRIVFKVAVQTYRAQHWARWCPSVPAAVYTSRRHPVPTKTSVFHLGWSVRSCRQTAYCWTSCLLCRWRSCLERSSCRRHFSTFSVHFPKTFKTASFSTLLSWPCRLSHFFSLFGPCGSCLLLMPP